MTTQYKSRVLLRRKEKGKEREGGREAGGKEGGRREGRKGKLMSGGHLAVPVTRGTG